MSQANQPTARTDRLDVHYVAHLARLQLTADEERRFEEQLAHILDYFCAIRSLNVDGVEPTAHAIPVSNVMREDVRRASLDRERVMANAPESADGQFLVPKIIE